MVEFAEMDNPPTKKPSSPDDNKHYHQHTTKQTHKPKRSENFQEKPEGHILKLTTSLCHTGLLLVRLLISNASRILAELHIYDLLEETKVFVRNYPFIAVILACMTIACGIPVLVFVAFAAITIFFTFSGFLIIEGAVLAAGAFALLLCLATMAGVFVMMSFFGGLLYITFMQIANIVRTNSLSRDAVPPFDSRLPQVLASLRKLPHSNSVHHNHDKDSHVSSFLNSTTGHTHLHLSKQ